MQTLSVVFSFMFAFHPQPAHVARNTAFVPPAQYADNLSGIDAPVPSHREILSGVYAGSACQSCLKTNVSFTER